MFQESYMRRVGALVGIAAIIALLAYTYSTISQSHYMTRPPMSISVAGKGEIFAKPDIATISFSVDAKEKDATTAQTSSAKSINAITSYLKEKGVDDKDIRTQSYNLSPQYEYPSQVVCNSAGYCPPVGQPKLVGYEVSQTIEVKIRKTDDAGALISGVGELGATNINGPTFTIDDDTALQAQAREKAISDAKTKAEKLAGALNVRLVRMTGFSENGGPQPYYAMGAAESMKAYDSVAPAVAPVIPTGENTIVSNVNMTFEVR